MTDSGGRMAGGVKVKICGLGSAGDVEGCARAGASYAGFVFCARSPRSVEVEEARGLARLVPGGIRKVALTVDAPDGFLEEILSRVPVDMLQLHGDETPERVREVRSETGLPVMKAVGVAVKEDLERIGAYEDAADQLLVDAKPAPGGLPGGNGVAFDWELVSGRAWKAPWMLAGGLTPGNVSRAIGLAKATQVDVSSGVESSPGVKDSAKMADFVRAARGGRADG